MIISHHTIARWTVGVGVDWVLIWVIEFWTLGDWVLGFWEWG